MPLGGVQRKGTAGRLPILIGGAAGLCVSIVNKPPLPPSGIRKISVANVPVTYDGFRTLISQHVARIHVFNALIKGDVLNIAFNWRNSLFIKGQNRDTDLVVKGRYNPRGKLLDLIGGSNIFETNDRPESRVAYIKLARVLIEHGFPEQTFFEFGTCRCFWELFGKEFIPTSLEALARMPLPGFPSESANSAISEFKNYCDFFDRSLKTISTLCDDKDKDKYIWNLKLDEHSKPKLSHDNFSEWMDHGCLPAFQGLISNSNHFREIGYQRKDREDWGSYLPKWNDYLVALKEFADKRKFKEMIINKPPVDVSKNSEKNPMDRTEVWRYFLRMSFGDGSTAAKKRYAKFQSIVAEMEKIEPQYNKAAQIIIDDFKGLQGGNAAFHPRLK